jgi:hypothetical protein
MAGSSHAAPPAGKKEGVQIKFAGILTRSAGYRTLQEILER